MGRPHPVAVRPIRADQGHHRHHAGIGEQLGHLPDPPHVLGPVGRAETQVGVEPVAQVVAVEQVGGPAGCDQRALDLDGDGRLARTRQAGQPDGAARWALLAALHRVGVPDHVRSTLACSAPDDHARRATVLLVTGSTRMKPPVARLRR